jgi:hypothetical protein
VEILLAPGALPSLIDSVTQLEASKHASAIEMGGYVFQGKNATDAWVRSLNNPDVLCLQWMLSLFSCLLTQNMRWWVRGLS